MADEAIKAPEATEICEACKKTIPAGLEQCPKCKCMLTRGPCKVCGSPIPTGAKYCNACKSYQQFRLGFSTTVLAFLTALVAVLGPAIREVSDFLNRHSHTSMIVNDVGDSAVQVYVWNTGRQPSRIARAELDFGVIPVGKVQLQPAEYANTVIVPSGALTLSLKVNTELHRLNNATTDQIKALLVKEKLVKLNFTIDESNDPKRSLSIDLTGDRVHDLVLHNLEPDNG
jgi:hypothetical protein